MHCRYGYTWLYTPFHTRTSAPPHPQATGAGRAAGRAIHPDLRSRDATTDQPYVDIMLDHTLPRDSKCSPPPCCRWKKRVQPRIVLTLVILLALRVCRDAATTHNLTPHARVEKLSGRELVMADKKNWERIAWLQENLRNAANHSKRTHTLYVGGHTHEKATRDWFDDRIDIFIGQSRRRSSNRYEPHAPNVTPNKHAKP